MSSFKSRLSDVRFNPMLMQNLVLDELAAQLEGRGEYDVPDPSHPFVFLTEAMVLATTIGISENEALLRRLYPRMALTPEELYLHMTDEDYLGRFASPAWTTFELYLSRDEVLAKAVPDPRTGLRKLVLPRLTKFTVAETPFTMQYPVEFRIMSHGGLQLVYDTTVYSPIQTLETNLVDWSMVRIARDDVLVLRLPVGQFEVTTHIETLNLASGFNARYSYRDQFYHARVYISDSDGGWREIKTTHTDQVYDPLELTAVLQVLNGTVNIQIPLIYQSTGELQGELRIDLYTTKGPVDLDLGAYRPDQFQTQLVGLEDDSRFVAPLTTFNRMQALCPHRVQGGTNAIDFVTLRRRVIDNTLGTSRVPITHAQLETELQSRGYTVVTNIDNITNRQFLATKRLPAPLDTPTTGDVGCVMGQLQATMEQLGNSSHVRVNGDRLTILPSMLYRYHQGVVTHVDDVEIERLQTGTPDAIARTVSDRRLLYSPLHYVLDASGTGFDVRPYYLDQPEVLRRAFVEENDSVQIEVGIEAYSFERIDDGYRLTVTLTTDDRFKEIDDAQVHVQLGYRPLGESSYTGLMGELVGNDNGKRTYRFDILTNYDIDQRHGLYTTNMSMFDESQRVFATGLEHEFDITILTSIPKTYDYRPAAMDSQVQTHLLPNEFMTISRERLLLRFGYSLENLWRRNRTLISENSYKRYTADVPAVYSETIYKRDENGQVILELDENNNIVYEVLHQKGDPVLDADGNPVYQYLKGDVVLDANGQPELLEGRKLLREFTLFLVDGSYYFVTDPAAVAYREQIPMQLVGWLKNDVGLISRRLLEQSELYLYPTTTIGDTMALVRDGMPTTLALEQSLFVNYYLTETAYSDVELREALIATTRDTVNAMLGQTTVAVADIISRLRASVGEEVVNIEVGGLGGDANYSVVSIQDDAVRMSLKKRLTVLSNQLLAVQDDIEINFFRHAVGR